MRFTEKKTLHLLHPHGPLQAHSTPQRAVTAAQHGDSHQDTAPLRHEGAKGNAFYLHAEGIDEKAGEADVDNVLRDGYDHGQRCVLHTHEPSRDGIECQRGQSAPYTYIIIGVYGGKQARLRLNEPHGKAVEGLLKKEQQRRHGKASEQRAQQYVTALLTASRPRGG